MSWYMIMKQAFAMKLNGSLVRTAPKRSVRGLRLLLQRATASKWTYLFMDCTIPESRTRFCKWLRVRLLIDLRQTVIVIYLFSLSYYPSISGLHENITLKWSIQAYRWSTPLQVIVDTILCSKAIGGRMKSWESFFFIWMKLSQDVGNLSNLVMNTISFISLCLVLTTEALQQHGIR